MNEGYVNVYEDPLTRTRLEGRALVVMEHGDYDEADNKRCSVIFTGESQVYVRLVHRSELEHAE